MTRGRMSPTRLAAGALVATMAFTGAGVGAGAAQASASSTAGSVIVGKRLGGLTADQWRVIARTAQASGDSVSAQVAAQAAVRAQGRGGVGTQSLSSIARKLIKAALKHGRQYLPAKIRPWADRLYDLIDLIDSSTELAVSTFLISQGIPPDVARATAQWIMFFV